MEKQKHAVYPTSLLLRVFILALAVGFGHCSSPKDEQQDYEIASPVYIALAEKSLDYLANFEFDSFATMLADEVEYELPDGQRIFGKTAVIAYWEKYRIVTGILSMSFVNANYVPIVTHIKPRGNEPKGIKVLADFTNNIRFKDNIKAVKMHFSLHFNEAKLIDRMSANYDSSKIVSNF